MIRGIRRAVAAAIVVGVGVVAAPATLAAHPSVAAAPTTVNVVASSATCSSSFCFKPQVVKIANNTAVTWVNRSGATHTITRCTPAACAGHGGGTGKDIGFGQLSLAANQQYAFTFDAPGTYAYYCAIHGYAVMHGTVSVH